MPSFGEQLRQARESQNITLQEIAATTKISSRALQALESEQFDQLPGGIFNKGFVRAYARYVGLDEEKMLAAYVAAAKDAPETDIQTVTSQIAAARRPQKESRIGGTTVMGIIAVIVALLLGALWFREHRREAREQAAIQAAPPSGPVRAAPQLPPQLPTQVPEATPSAGAPAGSAPGATGEASPAATPAGAIANSNAAPNAASGAPPNAGTAAANAPANAVAKTAQSAPSSATQSAPANPLLGANQKSAPAANAGATAAAKPESVQNVAGQAAPVEVSLSATQQVWISVRGDGKPIESLTLDPDKPELRSRTYKAKEKLRIVVGNAGGITAVCNGKPEGVLGAEGQARTITFTQQGIEKR